MQFFNAKTFTLAALFGLTWAELEQRQQTTRGSLKSCPGVINVQSSSTVCCVGGSLSLAPLDLSSCAGWPICTGPVTVTPSSTPDNPPLTCATVIDMNNPSYSSMLASATASIRASGTKAATTINPTGAAAPGSTSNGGSASATSRPSGSSSSSSNAAAPTLPILAAGSAAFAGAVGLAGLLL